MREDWRVRLQKLSPEYERLSSGGAAFSALAKLGELIASAEGQRQDIQNAIRHMVSGAVLEEAATEAVAVQGRALRILSIGTRFTWDELVLVLTMRMQLELASLVMTLFGVESSTLDLAAIDTELRDVAKANAAQFVSALATIRRNWDTAIVDRWST